MINKRALPVCGTEFKVVYVYTSNFGSSLDDVQHVGVWGKLNMAQTYPNKAGLGQTQYELKICEWLTVVSNFLCKSGKWKSNGSIINFTAGDRARIAWSMFQLTRSWKSRWRTAGTFRAAKYIHSVIIHSQVQLYPGFSATFIYQPIIDWWTAVATRDIHPKYSSIPPG